MTDILTVLKAKGERYFSPGYGDLLTATGLTIEASRDFGSYQGDSIAIVSDGKRRGIVVWGYGSCSGCDNLEAITPSAYDEAEAEQADWSKVNALADEMRESVRWAEDGDLAAVAKALLAANDWYIYDTEMRLYVTEIAAGITPKDED